MNNLNGIMRLIAVDEVRARMKRHLPADDSRHAMADDEINWLLDNGWEPPPPVSAPRWFPRAPDSDRR